MRYKLAPALLTTAIGMASAIPAAAQQGPSPAMSAELPEIVVTADKRSTIAQDLPLQVSVLTGEALGGATQVQDLQNLVPGIQMQQSGPFTQFNVRGVGAVVTSAYNDSAIAFNLDEVYLARPTGMQGIFYDIERVEILKGPQGTLYGRNASAGAINVITKQPRFENEFGLTASYGNYDSFVANGFANFSLGSTAVRLAAQVAQRNGYFADGYDDEDTKAVRVQTLTEADDTLTIALGGDYAEQKGRSFGLIVYPYLGADPWDVGPSSPATRAAITNIGNYGEFGRIRTVNKGLRGKIDWDIGPGSWTTIASYRVSDVKGTTYLGGIAATTDTRAKQYSLETRIASTTTEDDAFRWLVGLYYFREEQKGFTTVDTGDVAVPSPPAFFPIPAGDLLHPNTGFTSVVDPTTDESYAIFTQETVRLLPRLKLTGGLRYFVEKKKNSGSNTFYTSAVVPVPPLVIPATGRLEWEKLNYRVGLDYELGSESLLYASVSNGWHAGGFLRGAEPGPGNPNALANSYEPETLTAYVIGTKNRFLDNRLQVNAELFYWDYKNRQYTALAPINTGGPPGFPVIDSRTVNVGKSHIQGASVELVFLADPRTMLSANVEYIDEARNDRNLYDVATITGVPLGCSVLAVDPVYGRTTVDCSGTAIPFVPRWSMTLGFNRSFPIGDKSSIVLDAISKIATRHLVGTNGTPLEVQGGYSRTNVSLSYRRERFRVTAQVRNLENKAVRTVTAPSFGGPFNPSPPFVAQLMSPRTFTVELSFNY